MNRRQWFFAKSMHRSISLNALQHLIRCSSMAKLLTIGDDLDSSFRLWYGWLALMSNRWTLSKFLWHCIRILVFLRSTLTSGYRSVHQMITFYQVIFVCLARLAKTFDPNFGLMNAVCWSQNLAVMNRTNRSSWSNRSSSPVGNNRLSMAFSVEEVDSVSGGAEWFGEPRI